MKDNSLGPIGNSIAGVLGGGAGGMILQSVMGGNAAAGGGSMDLGTIVSNVAGGGVGGSHSHGRRRPHQKRDGEKELISGNSEKAKNLI